MMHHPTYPDLESMRNVDIQCVDLDTIPDSRDIKVDIDKPVPERILDYIKQAQNPYFIRCGKILVKIKYAETARL